MAKVRECKSNMTRESSIENYRFEILRSAKKAQMNERSEGGEHIEITGGQFPSQKQLCIRWKEAKSQNKTIKKLMIPGRAICTPHRAGNMLLALFSVQMMAYNQDIDFDIFPPCNLNTSILAWLPQNTWAHYGRQWCSDAEARKKDHKDLCKESANPLPVTSSESSWINFSKIWATDLQTGLSNWAKESGKETVKKKTASLHIRCGDILTAGNRPYGFQALNFYTKHLVGKGIMHIDILAPPFVCNKSGRPQDCRNGKACSKIVNSLKEALSQKVGINPKDIRVRDMESDLWVMHHIAFSDMVICSPCSSFCGVTSIASKHAVHQLLSGNGKWYSSFQHLSKFFPDGTFVFDRAEYLSIGDIIDKNMSTDQIVSYLLTH